LGWAQEMLPAEWGNWKASPAVTAAPAVLEQLAGGDAPYLREYGITSAERRTYTRNSETLQVTLFCMVDSTAAYGAFTFLRTAEMAPVGDGPRTIASENRALLLTDQFVVEVTGPAVASLAPEWKALRNHLSRFASGALFPTLPNYLPLQGLVAGTERYVLGPLALERVLSMKKGDWLGFDKGAEALLAHYEWQGKKTKFLLVAYPNHAIAREHAIAMRGKFNVNGGDVPTSTRTPIFVRQLRSIVAIAAETDSPEWAQQLLKRVDYQESLTMNEPGFRATDRPLVTLIYSMFVAIGILIAFALIAGIAFGGVRIAVKRFFPGRVFDRSQAVEIIQLGLTSKPIEAKDFY
jgi:hypothetical protein